MLLLEVGENLPGVPQRLVLEIHQHEFRVVGQWILAQEILHLAGRAAAEVENARRASRRGDPSDFLMQPRGQLGDAVAVRLRGRVAEEADVHHFREKRRALEWVAQDHVHHLVVPRVAERFLIRAIDEGRAQQERMQLAARESAVNRAEAVFHFVRDFVEPREPRVHDRQHFALQFADDLALDARHVARRFGADAQFQLLQPPPQIHEERLHVGHHHFEIRTDGQHLLPLAQELGELGVQFLPLVDRRKEIHLDPRLVEAHLAH